MLFGSLIYVFGKKKKKRHVAQLSAISKKVPRLINTMFGHIIAGGLPSYDKVTNVMSLLCTSCDNNIERANSINPLITKRKRFKGNW